MNVVRGYARMSRVRFATATAESEVVSDEDLRVLAAAKSPCITVAFAVPDPLQTRTRLKNAVDSVEKGLKDTGIGDASAAFLTAPIRALAADIEEREEWSKSIVIFRSPDIFRYFAMRDLEHEFITVGERFQLRPLLGLLSRHQQFYLLALSLKHVRLFHCTHHSGEELDWRGLAPQSLQVRMNARQPDHVLDNRAAGGPSVGSMKGVVFGTDTDRERQDEYVMHFFNQVDKALEKILVDKSIPLILAGVELEIALYRRVNTYPQLMDREIHGSPDGLPARELRERALKTVKEVFSAPLRKALDWFEQYRGTSRVASKLDEILKAASEGRVSDLILREDAAYLGIWDACAQTILAPRDHSGQEDLLNRAALETVIRKGQAFAVKASEMPNRMDAFAVLRF